MLRTGQTFAGLRVVGTLNVNESGEIYLVKAAQAAQEDILLLIPESRGKDPAYRQAFTQTATAAAGLDHPGIVPVRAHGEENGRLWLLSGYVPAPSADAVVRQSGPLAPREAAAAVTAVAAALDAARAGGVPVGELTPAQILVDDQGGTRAYLVSGVGVPPRSGRIPKPEDRADQAELGELAAFLLTGGTSIGARVTTLRPELPADVDAVLSRVRQPAAQRYTSCGEFAGALATALVGAEEAAAVKSEADAAAAAAAAAKANQPTSAYPTTGQDGSGSSPGTTVPGATVPGATVPGATTPGAVPPGGPVPPTNVYGAPAQSGTTPAGAPYAGPGSGSFPPQQTPYGAVPPGAGYPGGYQQQPYGAMGGYPGGPGMPPVQSGGKPGGNKKAVYGALIGVGVLIVVIALVLVFVLGGDDDPSTVAASSSKSSSATTSSTTTSSTPNANVVAGVPTSCAPGSPTFRTSSPNLEVGPIRIPQSALPAGWNPDRGSQLPFLVLSDGIVVSRPPGQNWQAQLLVGTLPSTFTGDLEAVGAKFLECLAQMPGFANTNVRTPVIENRRKSTLDNSPTELVLFRGRVPVSRGPIDADEFTMVIADTLPRSLAIGLSANIDPQSKGEIDEAIKETLFRTRR